MIKLVFASNNQNKIAEISAMIPNNMTILSLDDIGCTEEIPETASTIEGNAKLKADYISENYGYDCFADDTGLEVDALNGDPGVFSARYSGEHKNANDNMDKLLSELSEYSNRAAQFKTVIALNRNHQQHFFTGIIRGEITNEKLGDQGFGYDPIFKPQGHNQTFAQMSMIEKALLSHRGIAVKQLIDFLKK